MKIFILLDILTQIENEQKTFSQIFKTVTFSHMTLIKYLKILLDDKMIIKKFKQYPKYKITVKGEKFLIDTKKWSLLK